MSRPSAPVLAAGVGVAVAVAAVAALGLGTPAGAAGAPRSAPTTLAPPAVPTAPVTTTSPSTTFDNSTGPLAVPGGGGVLPVYTTCEEAILPPTSTEACSAVATEGFNLFGGKLGLLYATDLPISLGVWAPVGNHDWAFNESALYACIGVFKGEDETVWLDYQLMTYTDYSAAADEKLFDAAMAYVCPELEYTRRGEWDFHVPAQFLASTTTLAPAGPTTVPAGTAVPAVPTVPVTTIGGVIPTVPTTVAGDVLTTQIDTADGPRDYTCAEIVSIRDTQTPCDAATQAVFDSIVTANAGAFNAFVYDVPLGWFSTNDINVPETAFVGLWACASASAGVTYADYDAYIRGVFAPPGPADTRLAWDAAFSVLCPFIAPPG